MHKLTDLRVKKNGNDSVNFIGSFDNLVMSNILDILLLAAGLRLSQKTHIKYLGVRLLRLLFSVWLQKLIQL